LTKKNLSRAFETKLKLQFESGRFAMDILPKSGAVI
jgi:hypothetical protein